MKKVKLWDIIAWSNWLFPLLLRVVAKVLAPVAYPFIDKKDNPIWGVEDAKDFGFYNVAIRNGAHNFFNKPSVPYEELSNTWDYTLEKTPGLQWRLRRATGAGNYISLRVTWGDPDPEDGKKEFYIGWTMDDKVGRMRPTFQFRPF